MAIGPPPWCRNGGTTPLSPQSLLTAHSQGQAPSAAPDEIVEGVIGLVPDLGADAGAETEYGTDGSCGVTGVGGQEIWVESEKRCGKRWEEP